MNVKFVWVGEAFRATAQRQQRGTEQWSCADGGRAMELRRQLRSQMEFGNEEEIKAGAILKDTLIGFG